MCGPRGPSQAEINAMNESARASAEAEAKRLQAERDAEKERENAKLVSDQAAAADRDAERRVRNRTLLAGLEEEEGTGLSGLEDPNSASSKKAKRARSLIGGV